MHTLRYTAQTLDDLKGIARYLSDATSDRAFGARFVKRLRARCKQIAVRPQIMGRRRPELAEDLRSVSEDNYIIFFRYLGDVFEVIRIVERHRDMAALFSVGGGQDDPGDE